VLNRGGERIVMPGDSVLLADTEALPWHKVQAILPLDGGGSDDNIMYKTGTTMIVFGYICAILFPLIGLILGLILANSTQMTPRGRMKTYMPSAITNGWVIFSLACLVMIVNFILVINLFNYY
jgi:hypothetical protein